MLQWTYALPLNGIVLLIGAAICVWGYVNGKQLVRQWKAANVILCAASLMVILYVTLHRTSDTHAAVLRPFSWLKRAKEQPELYREMLMNVFLFFPLGLTLSNALPQKWHRWGRIALTTALCCMFSALIEYTQFRCALGMAETDDVICNTLGSFFGACSLLIAHLILKWQNHSNR